MDERKTIPQRMDGMVMWTGIPQRIARPLRRRPLPWLSSLTAAGALAGFVVGAAAGFNGRAAWLGYGLLMASFIAGTLMQVFGPLKPFARTGPSGSMNSTARCVHEPTCSRSRGSRLRPRRACSRSCT